MDVCCPLEWSHACCFRHTLQRTIVSCKKLVKHFRKSVVVSNALTEKQRQMSVKETSLIIDCETCWNSTYNMFIRFLEQQLPVYALLHDPNFTKIQKARSLDITEEQVKIIEGLVPVLKPLYMATAAMRSEEYRTVGGVYPILFSLINQCYWHSCSKQTDVHADIVFRHRLVKDDICSSIGMMCTFLDPCYCSLPFLSDQERHIVHSKVCERKGTLDYQQWQATL